MVWSTPSVLGEEGSEKISHSKDYDLFVCFFFTPVNMLGQLMFFAPPTPPTVNLINIGVSSKITKQ